MCVYARARACVCVDVALLIQHATRMRHTMSFVDPLATQYFLTLPHKLHYLKKKVLNTKCVF